MLLLEAVTDCDRLSATDPAPQGKEQDVAIGITRAHAAASDRRVISYARRKPIGAPLKNQSR